MAFGGVNVSLPGFGNGGMVDRMAKRGEQVSLDRLLADIAERACAEARGAVGPQVLAGYLPALLAATAEGRRLARSDLRRCRELGGQAARDGVALLAIVDAYLSATRISWAQLRALVPAFRGRRLPDNALSVAGQTVLRAADDALAAVAEGYESAGRSLIRAEEALRREFVDDLLGGDAEVRGLVSRAERFGLRLTAPHQVAVVRAARAFRDTGIAVSSVEERLRARTPGREALVAAKDGHLVCVVAAAAGSSGLAEQGWLGELAARAVRELAAGDRWRAVIGRVQAGPSGIATSYREAREALDLAERIDWPEPLISVQQLAVYRVLLRDLDAMTELVQTVLGPLAAARGGAAPLLNTLTTFFSSGAVATTTARRLHLSVRAVTYRLARIRSLTGYDPTDPADWLTLHVAGTGARLLGWPSD